MIRVFSRGSRLLFCTVRARFGLWKCYFLLVASRPRCGSPNLAGFCTKTEDKETDQAQTQQHDDTEKCRVDRANGSKDALRAGFVHKNRCRLRTWTVDDAEFKPLRTVSPGFPIVLIEDLFARLDVENTSIKSRSGTR